MPSAPETDRPVSRKDAGTLLRELAGDVGGWAEAELALARAELNVLGRRLMTAAILGVLAIAGLLTALIILAQAGVASVAAYLGSEILAGLVVGVALLVLSALCLMVMRRMFTWQPESILLRWAAPPSDGKQAPQWMH